MDRSGVRNLFSTLYRALESSWALGTSTVGQWGPEVLGAEFEKS